MYRVQYIVYLSVLQGGLGCQQSLEAVEKEIEEAEDQSES